MKVMKMAEICRYASVVLAMSCLVGWSGLALAQANYQVKKTSKVSVDGTSTLHGWTATVNEFEGTIGFLPNFTKKGLKVGEAVQTVNLKFKVASMDGGRGETMNDKIKNALKNDKHPYIEFKSTAPASVLAVKDAKAGTFTIRSKGDLSMAGITKPVELDLEGQKMADGSFQFKGKKTMNMKDFSIEPPTAMFGQIVTGEEITINFELVVAP